MASANSFILFKYTLRKSYEVFDIWTDAPQDTYLYSSAFTNCINQRETKVLEPNSYDITLRLVVHAPQLRSFERLAIVGNLDVLGAWNINKALAMTEQQHNEWVIDINASSFIGEKIEFKFVAINTQIKVFRFGKQRITALFLSQLSAKAKHLSTH